MSRRKSKEKSGPVVGKVESSGNGENNQSNNKTDRDQKAVERRREHQKPHESPPFGSETKKDKSIAIDNNKSEDVSESTTPLKKRKQNVNNDGSTGVVMTKKQKQLQENDKKHLWPQQPKIKSSEARAKAYLRVAGLQDTNVDDSTNDDTAKSNQHKKKNASQKSKTPVMALDPKLDIDSPEMKFGRLLASTDQRVRHTAIQQMSMYLQARTDITDPTSVGLSELDLLKMWKGIWYCLYLADKVPVQQELSTRIANLIFSVAGTDEEDEYAGRAYMKICGDDDDDDFDEDDDEEEREELDDDDDDDDDYSVDMEEIENTLVVHDEENEDDEEIDDFDDDDDEDSENQGNPSREGAAMDEVEDSMESDSDDDDDENIDRSNVRHCRGAHLASLFVRTFFHTIRREWGNIDKYRVDKFYTLMRHMVHAIYKYMALRHWNRGIVRLFNDAIYEEVLDQLPNGLRFHLIDITLEEMVKVNNTVAPLPLTEATFLDCVEPYFAMAQTGAGGYDVVQQRVMEQFVEKFLLQYSIVSDNATLILKLNNANKKTAENGKASAKDEEKLYIFDDVHVRTIADFIFELASDNETLDRYRKSLYDMHKVYIRRLNEVGRDVDLDKDSKDMDEDEENEMDHDANVEGKLDTKKKPTIRSVTTDEEVPEARKSKDKRSKVSNIPSVANGASKVKKERKDKEKIPIKTAGQVTNIVDTEDNGHHEVSEGKKKKKKKKKRKDSDASDTSMGSDTNQQRSSSAGDKNGADVVDVKRSSKSSKVRQEVKASSSSDYTELKSKGGEKHKVNDVITTPMKDSGLAPPDQDNEEPISSSKKDKKKKKKKRKNSDASDGSSGSKRSFIADNDIETRYVGAISSFTNNDVPKVHSGEKKKKQSSKEADHVSGNDSKKVSTEVTPSKDLSAEEEKNRLEDADRSSSSKKRKKDKKKRKSSDASATNIEEAMKEEVVSISLIDQKDAKKAQQQRESKDDQPNDKLESNGERSSAKKSKKGRNSVDGMINSSKKKAPPDSAGSTGSKRVKFGEINRARSWKISMKNLTTMDTPISKTTPERGILRNKHKMHQELLKKANKKGNANGSNGDNRKEKHQQRKKASEYF